RRYAPISRLQAPSSKAPCTNNTDDVEAERVPSCTRDEMRIRICAEQVQLGCSNWSAAQEMPLHEGKVKLRWESMWTSTSGALGLERERWDQGERRIDHGRRTHPAATLLAMVWGADAEERQRRSGDGRGSADAGGGAWRAVQTQLLGRERRGNGVESVQGPKGSRRDGVGRDGTGGAGGRSGQRVMLVHSPLIRAVKSERELNQRRSWACRLAGEECGGRWMVWAVGVLQVVSGAWAGRGGEGTRCVGHFKLVKVEHSGDVDSASRRQVGESGVWVDVAGRHVVR
ncbi:hypothetical protein DFH08DRAFT_1002042, partial [Mycena albidolilacea]